MSRDPHSGSTPRPDFGFELLDAEGQMIVKLSGELDLSGAPELREALVQVSGGTGREVLVDLDALTFIDSTGISVLVMACKRIRSEGGVFSLSRLSDPVHRLLEVMGILDYLKAPLSAEEGHSDS
jgi:anti-sigma B factor antagonist